MLRLTIAIVQQQGQMMPHMNQNPINWTLVALAVVAFSALLVYLLFPRLNRVRSGNTFRPHVEKFEREPARSLPEAEIEAGNGGAMDVALRLLEPDEKRVVEAIGNAGGSMLQKDISHELGFSRVKTHRVMVRLLRRGVVTAEKHYNTNLIELVDWLRE